MQFYYILGSTNDNGKIVLNPDRLSLSVCVCVCVLDRSHINLFSDLTRLYYTDSALAEGHIDPLNK